MTRKKLTLRRRSTMKGMGAFGADYIPVEPVLGHAVIARRGIALALSELAEEGWMSLDGARGNTV